jgi:glycogen operon protein
VQAARIRTLRNLIASLLLSQGVPMITAGDELGRTQRGNNNAYCQDNAVSWVNWTLTDWQRDLLATVRRLMALRAAHPALRRPTAYSSAAAGKTARPAAREIRWLRPDGKAMTEADWSDPALRTLVARLSHAGDVVVLGVHAGAEPTWVRLPADDAAYDLLLDTRSAAACDTIPYRIGAGRRLDLAARTVVLLTAAPAHRGPSTPVHPW